MNQNEKVMCAWIQAESKHFKAENIAFYESEIEKVAAQGAEVVFLPELFHADYFAQTEEPRFFDEAIQLEGSELKSLQKLAKDKSIVLCVPFFEKRDAGLYHNSCVVIDENGEVLDLYRKMHIPDDPGFYEKYYFTPGDLGWKVVKTSKLNIGLLICWDQWFPEAARLTAMAGAHCLYYPTAIAWDVNEPDEIYDDQLQSWMIMLRSHSIANGCFTVAVNRVGQENDLKFWGHSIAVNPMGKVLNPLSETYQSQLIELDLNQIETQRRAWPFFRDRRVDAYGDLNKIWRS